MCVPQTYIINHMIKPLLTVALMTKQFCALYKIWEFVFHFNKTRSLDPIMTQLNPFLTLTPYSFKIHFIDILPSKHNTIYQHSDILKSVHDQGYMFRPQRAIIRPIQNAQYVQQSVYSMGSHFVYTTIIKCFYQFTVNEMGSH